MTRTDEKDKGVTEQLPTKTFVIPEVEITDEIEPTDTEDTFTPPTKVSIIHLVSHVTTRP